MAGHVGNVLAIRYAAHGLSEIRVFDGNYFLCLAASEEHAKAENPSPLQRRIRLRTYQEDEKTTGDKVEEFIATKEHRHLVEFAKCKSIAAMVP
jgi:hypothetical protein